eukprot:m.16460 g.16460  ORF g.16460 m.16460 type:complete len:783 (-) comp5707_c0_seq1:221-2569(-)
MEERATKIWTDIVNVRPAHDKAESMPDWVATQELHSITGNAFREDSVRHGFVPIDLETERKEYERISSAVAAATVKASQRPEINFARMQSAQDVAETVANAATEASGGYTYEWQRPPLYKVVLLARMEKLREEDLMANGGVLLAEWHALIGTLDACLRHDLETEDKKKQDSLEKASKKEQLKATSSKRSFFGRSRDKGRQSTSPSKPRDSSQDTRENDSNDTDSSDGNNRNEGSVINLSLKERKDDALSHKIPRQSLAGKMISNGWMDDKLFNNDHESTSQISRKDSTLIQINTGNSSKATALLRAETMSNSSTADYDASSQSSASTLASRYPAGLLEWSSSSGDSDEDMRGQRSQEKKKVSKRSKRRQPPQSPTSSTSSITKVETPPRHRYCICVHQLLLQTLEKLKLKPNSTTLQARAAVFLTECEFSVGYPSNFNFADYTLWDPSSAKQLHLWKLMALPNFERCKVLSVVISEFIKQAPIDPCLPKKTPPSPKRNGVTKDTVQTSFGYIRRSNHEAQTRHSEILPLLQSHTIWKYELIWENQDSERESQWAQADSKESLQEAVIQKEHKLNHMKTKLAMQTLQKRVVELQEEMDARKLGNVQPLRRELSDCQAQLQTLTRKLDTVTKEAPRRECARKAKVLERQMLRDEQQKLAQGAREQFAKFLSESQPDGDTPSSPSPSDDKDRVYASIDEIFLEMFFVMKAWNMLLDLFWHIHASNSAVRPKDTLNQRSATYDFGKNLFIRGPPSPERMTVESLVCCLCEISEDRISRKSYSNDTF